MKNIAKYIGIWVALMMVLILPACKQDGLQPRLERAEQQTERLASLLQPLTAPDSIRLVAEEDKDIYFYIFDSSDHYELIYWSSNRLIVERGDAWSDSYDQWEELRLGYVDTKARWTKAGRYTILTVVPTRYPELTEYPDIDKIATETFSFREVMQPHAAPYASSRTPFILCHVLFGLVILIGIIGIIRHRGFKNMRLSSRMLYIIMGCVLAVFIYFFFMSIRYVHSNFEERQRRGLLTRSEYIQSFLRSRYNLFMEDLTKDDAKDLAIELRDLGYDLNQDVHVYSRSGDLIASSSEALFAGQVLYHRMSPEALDALRQREQNAKEGGHIRPFMGYEYIGSHPYLMTYLPFYNDYYITIGYIGVPYFLSEQRRNAEVDALLAKLLPPYIVVLLLALIFSFWAARSMSKPISLLADKMRRFEIGGKDNHIDYPYKDELGALVERYNMLVDQVEESAGQLARSEREGAWRTMARQIAHEINNPLTPMKLSVQKLQRLRGTENFDAYFEKATPMLISEIDNLAHIAQSFSAFAKQPEVTTDKVDIAQKLSQVITLQRSNDEQIPVRYIGADSGVTVLADPEQVSQVFVNIIKNAIQASPTDIIVTLNTAYSEREVQISISDNGCGIPVEVQAKIFQPNFTTKSNGNGLGLAISKHIVEGTGGRIDFESSDKGTTFYIYFRKK